MRVATSADTPLTPRYLAAGDKGLVVEFGDTIDIQINRRVVALDHALCSLQLDGVQECVPTYRSLLVVFDPLRISRDDLIRHIQSWGVIERLDKATGNGWIVPVLYGGAAGIDLDFVASTHGISPQAVIELHSSAE